MKRFMLVMLIAVLLWSAGVTYAVQYVHWLWGIPLALLGGAVIGLVAVLRLLRGG